MMSVSTQKLQGVLQKLFLCINCRFIKLKAFSSQFSITRFLWAIDQTTENM